MDIYAKLKVPEEHTQPGRIFELMEKEQQRKGKVEISRDDLKAFWENHLNNSIFIRDSEIPQPNYDPTATDPMPELPALSSDSMSNGTDAAPACNQPFCRLGCVCLSIETKNRGVYIKKSKRWDNGVYDNHCRDTGANEECLFGCVCKRRPGPKKLKPESQWAKPHVPKKYRLGDDCGYSPLGEKEEEVETEIPITKRQSKRPSRYCPDQNKFAPPARKRRVKSKTVCLDASAESDARASGMPTDAAVSANRGRKPNCKNGSANQTVEAGPPPPQRQNIRKNATNVDFVTSQSSTDAIQAKLGPKPKRAVRPKEPKPLAHCTFLNMATPED